MNERNNEINEMNTKTRYQSEESHKSMQEMLKYTITKTLN